MRTRVIGISCLFLFISLSLILWNKNKHVPVSPSVAPGPSVSHQRELADEKELSPVMEDEKDPSPVRPVLTAKSLRNMQPVDNGLVNPNIRGIVARSAVIVGVFIEPIIGGEEEGKLLQREELLQRWVESGREQQGKIVDQVAIKGEIPNMKGSTFTFIYDRYPTVHSSQWSFTDLLRYRKPGYYLVFSNEVRDDVLVNPDRIHEYQDAESFRTAIKDAEFTLVYSEQDLRTQLTLYGLSRRHKEEALGRYMGNHLGQLYRACQPSRRPKLGDLLFEGIEISVLGARGLMGGVGYTFGPGEQSDDAVKAFALAALGGFSYAVSNNKQDLVESLSYDLQGSERYFPKETNLLNELLKNDEVRSRFESVKDFADSSDLKNIGAVREFLGYFLQ